MDEPREKTYRIYRWPQFYPCVHCGSNSTLYHPGIAVCHLCLESGHTEDPIKCPVCTSTTKKADGTPIGTPGPAERAGPGGEGG